MLNGVDHIQVAAGRALLEGYVKTPPVGLCELIWNAFDEDAKSVEVSIERNDIQGIDVVRVQDDGRGMDLARAKRAFSTVGDSWKLMPGTKTEGDRPVHGRYGRGRYAAFSLGDSVRWVSSGESFSLKEGVFSNIEVRGQRSHLDRFDIETIPVDQDSTGTRVEITNVTQEATRAFEQPSSLRQRILMEFALHLDRHSDFIIDFLGDVLDPEAVVDSRTEIPLDLPDDIEGEAALTVIEWRLSNVERHLYLCRPGGHIVADIPPGIQSAGAEFTAYIEWSGFIDNSVMLAEMDEESPLGQVLKLSKDALRSHLAQAGRKRESATLKRWQAEGVYPYKEEPKSNVERATRDVFNVVALAATRTVDEAKTPSAKAMALSLLRETFENNPESLLPILKQFSKLPASRIEELRDLLERTTLAQLISLGKEVGGRIDFLNGLNALLFDRSSKKRLLERRQLHRILAHETWLFGEEWSLTGDDERLTEVLKKFLAKLGVDVELSTGAPVLREDGSDGIPDLVLGRQLETRANHYSHLVVELKRPSHKLTDEDVSQLRGYASAITNDERFDQPNSEWEFWLVGNETTASVDEQREQQHLPFGVVQQSKKYRLIVRTWSEIIGDAEHRLKFVDRSLQYESNRDKGLAAMRTTYAQFLPNSVLGEVDMAPDIEPADEDFAAVLDSAEDV